MAGIKRSVDKTRAKAKISVSEDSWRSEIENLSLNDDRWSCIIAMIVETRPDHAEYLELFNEAADEEKRESIFSLSYEKLIRGIKLLGKSNKNQGICNFASKKMEAEGTEGGIDPWLICRLIKFFINRAKTRNLEIQQNRSRIEKEITKEIETLGKARLDTPAKSKGGSGDAKSFDKVNTRLRKRGEEWRDRVRIDDAPIEGPNLYVVLSGFRDLKLATELLDAGLPLTAIFKVFRPGEELDVHHPQLYSFWSNLETALKVPREASRFSNVVFQTLCPPEIKETDAETLKTDAYRRISFLMYDLWDLKRQYNTYMRKMKLQSGLEEERSDSQTTGTYDTIMSVFPEECASVPLILDALLCQIGQLKSPEESLNEWKKTSQTFQERLQSKIDHLNNKFDVFDISRAKITHPQYSESRLILHGDDLASKTHHCSLELCPSNFGLRVLRECGISMVWKNVPVLTSDKMKMHKYHVGQISECFEMKIDSLTTGHYLHLLLFDKLINRELQRENILEKEDLERKISFPSFGELGLKLNVKRTKSEKIASDKSLVESLHSSFKSDSMIEYGKGIAETFECPELFSVIDTREMLGCGYLETAESFTIQNPGISDLEEFDTVQLFPPDVFSQIFFTCCQQFDAFEKRYFAPTDSMLIFFHNKPTGDRMSEQEYSASIRTPVCLRDFSEFIIFEEKEWLDKEDKIHSKRVAEETTFGKTPNPNDAEDLPVASAYTDADFILENSIKGSGLRKQKSRQTLIDGTETKLPAQDTKKLKKGKETGPENVKMLKKKEKVREGSSETNAPFQQIKETPSEDAEPFFLGYDIANHRVQVSGSTSKLISEDGTTVEVNVEEWTYGSSRLQIIVELLSNKLVVHNVFGDEYVAFHFMTANGILMGFSLPLKSEEMVASQGSGQSITKTNYQGSKRGRESETSKGMWTSEMAVDPEFKVSWPSGLVVETLPGDGPSEPFYIKQSYLSKGPECNGISRETGRVFLRNGTILVFLDDDSVRLMRSNGCIVTCYGFAKREKEESADLLSASKLKIMQNSRGTINVKTKRKASHSAAEDGEIPGPESAGKSSPKLKILRSVVLEPDGRLYEIFNEEETRELGQELVRTASDYEVGEKFTRRNDGTNILINNNGFLAISFPDGSRITSGYEIEKDLVYCEWTEEEFRRFHPPSKSGEDILEEDGFVSIFLTSCMEHKNYATVAYDQSKIECDLSMPGEVGVKISSDGFFNVIVNARTSLEAFPNFISSQTGKIDRNLNILSQIPDIQVKKNEISFTGKIGTSSSSAVLTLENFPGTSMAKKSFFETTDSLGNVSEVNFEGKISYKKFYQRSDPPEEAQERYSSAPNLPAVKTNQLKPTSKEYRLFVVKRDLSAHEYLRHSERQIQEAEQTTRTFFLQVNEEPNQKICTTLTELDSITASHAWLQPYRVKSIRPTNEDRKDLLRSTYSIPWNYLIPYGKNGQGIWERTRNQPLKSYGDFSSPEWLLARTTQTIKNREEKVLKKLQQALGCYWKKAINNFGEYKNHEDASERSASPEKREIENWLNDFALGGKRTFDKSSYFDGTLKSETNTQSSESRVSKKRNSRLEDKTEYKEEVEWYKTCLKDQTVPPYFANIHGACFTWVLECVNKVYERKTRVEDADEEEEEEAEGENWIPL